MKKIGIIGGLSAYSTIEYYRILVEEYNNLRGDNHSPELVIDSLNLQIVSDLMEAEKWAEVAGLLKKSAQNLMRAGAEILIMATNTPHMVFKELVKDIPIPFPSIMGVTAQAIKAQNLSKVGLLGTLFTMRAQFYPEVLGRYAIEVLTPQEEDQKRIYKIIWEELAKHILSPTSKKYYLEVIEKLVQQGAEGIILGCTEIPLLIKQEDCSVPVFDTTTIHAKAALQLAIADGL